MDTSDPRLTAHYQAQATAQPADLDAFWMPFSANRQFKSHPRLLVSAEGMHYRSVDGREILDGTGGLWCCNAGHARPRIVQAVQQQIQTMDFAPTFQMGHPLPFVLAERLKAIAPDGIDHVFFTNSGSESVDTALKIALAYHRARGEGQRTRLIGREKGYHGVGFGGISVGGLPNNRKVFGSLLPGVDHLRHTLDIGRNAFTRGLPEHGADLADDLERLVAEAIEQLPFKQRIVVILFYLHDMDLIEIAELLDLPPGTVKSRLHYGRARLREQLSSDLRLPFFPELSHAPATF